VQKVLTNVSLGISAMIVPTALLLGCGGSAELSCPTPGLPNPSPTYVQTLEGLVVVPARANLRSASEAESASFVDFVAELQAQCGEAPPASECEMGRLRAALVALPAPDHPALFTDIDGSLAAAQMSAHGDYAAADRDCDGQAEAVCDARAITGAFARAACELGGDEDSGGH